MSKPESTPVLAHSAAVMKQMRLFSEVIEEWLGDVDKFIFNNKEGRDPLLMIFVRHAEMKNPSWEDFFSLLRRQPDNRRLIAFVMDMRSVFMKLVPENVIRITHYDVKSVEKNHVVVTMSYATLISTSAETFSICLSDFLIAQEFREWIRKCIAHYFSFVSKMIQLLIVDLYRNPDVPQMQMPLIKNARGEYAEMIVLNPLRRGVIVDED